MRKNIILKSMLIVIFLLLINSTKSYCVESGTVRMEIKDGGTPWININLSEAYEECMSLNSVTSALGTERLQAHLTTNADWSAMAIFSISQFGASTSNEPKSTTNNQAGVMNVANGKFTYTTGLMESTTADTLPNTSGLFDENGSVKKYVKQWPKDRTTTNFVGFTDTWTWYGGIGNWNAQQPKVHHGLFGVNNLDGGPRSDTTFRPVIWN